MRCDRAAQTRARRRAAALVAGLLSLAVSHAHAESNAEGKEPAFFTVGGGITQIFRQEENSKPGYVRLEYRHGERYWIFKPIAGLDISTDGGFYVHAGFQIDVYAGRRWVISPYFSPGYWKDGSKIKLGHALEFRSGIEFAYRFDDRSRLGISLHHLSNANIGEKNPGTEALLVNYSVPLSRFFGN